MKTIIKRIIAILAIAGAVLAYGVLSEQDHEYFVVEHQSYAPQGGFIK